MSSKYQIIEPVNGICKIVLLQFKDDDTKVSFRGFSIHYDDGDNGSTYIQQVFNRRYRGDSREDIAVLEKMIVDYLDWYVINNSDTVSQTKYIQIIKLSLNGFRQLQLKAYKIGSNKKNNVKLALQYYINLITIITENPDKYKNKEEFDALLIPNELYNTNENVIKTSIDNKELSENKSYSDIKLVNIDGLKKLWKKDEIDKLYIELSSCFNENTLTKKTDNFTLAKVKSLMEILESKDIDFKDEIIKILGKHI